MSYVVTQNRIRMNEIAQSLPKNKKREKDDVLFNRASAGILGEASDIIENYISEAEWGTVVKTAFDRTIRYFQRDRVQARDLVRSTTTESEFHQWLEGTGFHAYWVARGAAKRTASFDFSSRYARLFKAGLAVEFPDETRDAMTVDLMAETMEKVVEAFDDLETNAAVMALSQGVANGTDYVGVKYSSHIIDGNSPKFSNPGKLDHDKFLAGEFILDDEGYEGSTVIMNNKHFYELMKLEPFRDSQGDWAYLTAPKAIRIVEGANPGQPILPGIQAKRIVSSNLFPEDEIVIFDEDEYIEHALREPLNSKVEPHDGLRDVSLSTFRTRYGFAARKPEAAVKIDNITGLDISDIFA